MKFEEWKRWKEIQTKPTCDYIGCTRPPVWVLPKNHAFFCAEHAAEKGGFSGLRNMYSETPVLFSEFR